MSNFEFLKEEKEYVLFANAAVEAEKIFAASLAMSAIASRKALELAVKWVYFADNSIHMPYKDNLQSLIHEKSFRFAVEENTWYKLPFIVKLGNLAVHTGHSISASDSLLSLRGLFEFIQWIDYCYGLNYKERYFSEDEIPKEKVFVDVKKKKEQEHILEEKNKEIEKLRRQIELMSNQFTNSKEQNQQTRNFKAKDISEFATRKQYIDLDLKRLGWKLDGDDADVWQEYPVNDMTGVLGQKGRIDYVLLGKGGFPLALIEAKRAGKDPNTGSTQAVLYADCLERKFKQRPMLFTTNGFETYFWDDKISIQRRVSEVFGKEDLQRLINRRQERKPLNEIVISDKITDRYYQKEAIRAVCSHIEQGFRKSLLVMATGTGKTRTAASLVDVLSRGGYVTNVLFLADRTALVNQAKDDFKKYLPNMSLCNLCSNKEDALARIVFSTYPTMLHAIDECKTKNGLPLFTAAHFDLIIADESHRSIFKKYKSIFEYFDAYLVGLTATPKTDVDRNTYDFFEMEHDVPTYAYDYETAVKEDHVLVPYYNYEVKTKFLEKGIVYDELSEEEKERYEEDFSEEDKLPDFISSDQLNKFVFSESTVDTVLQDLMEHGIKVNGGDLLGKTILFAQNKKHADFILKRFYHLYPQYNGFAKRIICDDAYAQTVIKEFKQPENGLRIAVSVDMLDTGIDVPECVNLVFFKKVRSKTKFWQMIGRGTRLAPDLNCVDCISGEYTGKKYFVIFDYCGNFEYFRKTPNGFEAREVKTLSETIFAKKIRLAAAMQEGRFAEERYQKWRTQLITECHAQVQALNPELVSVKLKREYVQRYCQIESFTCLSETAKGELTREIAPLVSMNETDEFAKRFDNFMYGMMLAQIEEMPVLKHSKKQLCEIAAELEKKITIPQIKENLSLLRQVQSDFYLESGDSLILEEIRKKFRGLMKFLADDGEKKKIIITKLTDQVLERKEGQELAPAYDFKDYRNKVNRYINEHGNSVVIHKLTHNIPLTAVDYKELERVFTEELGSKEDYKREFGEKPFGLLIREVAKLNHDAAMQAFSSFINDASLNEKQIVFVRKIIHHLEQNGYMEDIKDLTKPPFDKPISFLKLFDAQTKNALIQKINEIRENAVSVVS